MDNANLVQFLQGTGLVGLEIAREIAGHFSFKPLSKNEFILEEGKICDDYLFLESGFIRSFAFDTDGNDITTGFFSKNQVVFEVSSFFNRTRSRENIQALTGCLCWSINYQQLNSLFHNLHEFRDFGRYILVRGFAALKTRMLSMITETAEERYAALIKTNPEIFQFAPLKNIASYLGITNSSLSRIRRDFVKNSPA